VRRGLAHLLAMLREEGTIPQPGSVEPVYHELLEGYCRFLRDDRGLAETTIINYRRYVRDFLIGRGEAVSPSDLAQLTEDDLLAFSRERGASLGVTAWNHVALSLSSFWRWLDLRGHGTQHLIGAVPLRRKYRLADVPCALSWDQVQQLLAVVDRRELNGRRNYAMLLLAATYGLRSCESRALRLDDIDWDDDELTIFSPKTGRSRKLPLTRAVGEAILDYLREERPTSHHRQIFLSSQPPHGPLHSKINGWLARCFDRAASKRPPWYTPRHRWRSSTAQRRDAQSIGDYLSSKSGDDLHLRCCRRRPEDSSAGSEVVSSAAHCVDRCTA
jgi:integrase